MAAQLRRLWDYPDENGYAVAREQVQKAERGRIANRPRFREMIEKDSQLQAPFEVILLSIKL